VWGVSAVGVGLVCIKNPKWEQTATAVTLSFGTAVSAKATTARGWRNLVYGCFCGAAYLLVKDKFRGAADGPNNGALIAERTERDARAGKRNTLETPAPRQ